MNYKEFLNNSAIPFILTNENGLVMEANHAACELLNYSFEEIQGISSGEIIRENKAFTLSQNDHSSKSLREGFGIKKCGQKFSLEYKTHSIKEINKESSTALIILNHEVSSSGRELHKEKPPDFKEEIKFEFSRLFTENPSSGWILDQKNLKILDVNKTAINQYGYSKAEFLEKTIFDLLPEEEVIRLKNDLNHQKKFATVYTGYWQNKLKDGRIIHVDIPKNIMDDSDRVILLAIDVTAQIELQQIKENEILSKGPLINSTLDQIWSVSLDYKLIAANNSFINLLKQATGKSYKPGDVLTDHPFTKSFVEMWESQIQKAFQGERVNDIKFVPAHKGLPARWLEFFIYAIYKDNEIIGAVFHTRNITERIVSEQKIRESEANLAEAQRLANVGNWSIDLTTSELEWSDQLYNIYGINKKDFSKKVTTIIKLIDKTYKKEFLKSIEKTRNTGEAQTLIYSILTPSGQKKIIEQKSYGQKDSEGRVISAFGTTQDITQKMLTEEALRLSIESYDLVSKATNDSIWDWNMETGKVSRSGNGFKILFGYENDFANESEEIYNELIHPDDIESVKTSQNLVFNKPGEIYWEAEFRFRKADGTYAHVYDRGYIVRDENGKPKRMIGASQDITLQKEHLNEIKRIQRNLQVVINTTEDLIWSLDLDLKVITANKAFTEFVSHLFPESISEGESVLSPKLEKILAERWSVLYHRAIGGEKFTLEYEVLHRKLNEWRVYIVSFSPITNKEGSISGVACFARDITDLKNYARELENSQKRFKDLFHLSPQPMWLYEKETYKIREINKAAIRHYGYNEHEFLNMTIMDIRPESDRQITEEIINKRRSGETADFNLVFRHLKKNGEPIDVHIYSTPLEIDEKAYTLVAAIDVTEKRKHEHNINKAIIKAQENERFEIGSELHDNVCQLLASSKMRISILKEYIPEQRMAVFEESKEFIVTALEEIRNLSHRLAPSFFNDKTLEEAFTKLFNSFNFLKEYSIKMDFCEIAFQQELSLDLKLNLYRILQEQLKNIIKYAKASEIEVQVTCTNTRILRMRIADNGIGFNANEVKDGIGLSNMKRRAELSGGELLIITSPGNGTEIIVTIPLEEEV